MPTDREGLDWWIDIVRRTIHKYCPSLWYSDKYFSLPVRWFMAGQVAQGDTLATCQLTTLSNR